MLTLGSPLPFFRDAAIIGETSSFSRKFSIVARSSAVFPLSSCTLDVRRAFRNSDDLLLCLDRDTAASKPRIKFIVLKLTTGGERGGVQLLKTLLTLPSF